VPYDPALPVDTDWHLGIGDWTASGSLRAQTWRSTSRLPRQYSTVNGTLADCCQGQAIDSDMLRSLGIGSPA